MNMAARNHCSRPMARALHGHPVAQQMLPKALSRLNFQVKDNKKFGLVRGSIPHAQHAVFLSGEGDAGGLPTTASPKQVDASVYVLRAGSDFRFFSSALRSRLGENDSYWHREGDWT
jgi:hypothetical protein